MVSILFDLLTSKKIAPVPYRSRKKISSKLGAKGIKRSGILRWFIKCVELLRQEVPKDLLSEKRFLAKFSKSLKNLFFCANFFLFCKTVSLRLLVPVLRKPKTDTNRRSVYIFYFLFRGFLSFVVVFFLCSILICF